MNEQTYTISEVAEALGRVPHTIRVWGYQNRLPVHLQPSRNKRGWRVWTKSQVEGLKEWIIEADMTPGKGLRNRA
jgi:DNA-binding transcriptional MerR regulator